MSNKIKIIGERSSLCWLWITLLVLLLDYLSKQYVVQHIELYQSWPITSFFSISYVINNGAAFSFFSGWQTFLVVISSLVSILVFIALCKIPASLRSTGIALSLILGGALGNLFDRFYYGYVIDFLDFHFEQWHYPVFNLADTAIFIGAVLLIFGNMMLGFNSKNDAPKEE